MPLERFLVRPPARWATSDGLNARQRSESDAGHARRLRRRRRSGLQAIENLQWPQAGWRLHRSARYATIRLPLRGGRIAKRVVRAVQSEVEISYLHCPRCGLLMQLRGHSVSARDCPRCLIRAGVTMPMYKSQCAPVANSKGQAQTDTDADDVVVR